MKKAQKILTLVLVIVFTASITFVGTYTWMERGREGAAAGVTASKLDQLQGLIDTYFIDDVDDVKLQDAAAEAMISATGDRWSYYVSAADYARYNEQKNNAYVGVGITVTAAEDESGFLIKAVTEGGPAEAAGLQVDDKIIGVDGVDCTKSDLQELSTRVRGEEGSQVTLTLLRGTQTLEIPVTRASVKVKVAVYEMLENKIGYVHIKNFDANCAQETIDAVKALQAEGAKGLIFDVRFNPGGRQDQLVEILDYLLPEGPLFRSEDYKGETSVDSSDASCVDLPMAVLINGDSYSAAEFFAAALHEYDVAQTVGTQTCGKGHFQVTFDLQDGSAAALSIGKYFTPNGVCLADVGGLTPDYVVELTEEEYADLYYEALDRAQDAQLQKAISLFPAE